MQLCQRGNSHQRGLARISLNHVDDGNEHREFPVHANTFDDEKIIDRNGDILMRLQERVIAAPSSTELNGRFSIRVAICNHRSRRSDFEALVNAVQEIGRELLS